MQKEVLAVMPPVRCACGPDAFLVGGALGHGAGNSSLRHRSQSMVSMYREPCRSSHCWLFAVTLET